ncbi:MAG: DUF3311 domain-containing protein [Polyangiaceae bacterium]|nr:DUF3311 domain-containing protein [Polyangiaceae bacterium]
MPARPPDAPAHLHPRKLVWYLPLLAPFVGTLWVPFFNSVEPRAGGIPFFYWYQFAWIGLSAVITAVVYFATREPDEPVPPRAPAVPPEL